MLKPIGYGWLRGDGSYEGEVNLVHGRCPTICSLSDEAIEPSRNEMLSTMTRAMPQITLPDGESMPAYGQGTWHMGENRDSRADETAALRLGIDLGITLIDTAEMYANGVAEEIVADAMGQDREKLFIVSKVLPSNASQQGTIEACERSLRRLRTDRIDLYLLHWRAAHPFVETLAGFERLQRDGKIRHHGVSNFGRRDMAKWVSAGGANIVANQILYNLNRRDPEWGVIPWCHDRRISIMAYSPIEQGRMLGHKALAEVAGRHGAKPAQVALAWLLRQDGLIVIPKASQQQHVRENLGALDLTLTDDDLVTLDRAFPRPGRVSARQGLSYIYRRPALASVRTWITDMIRRPRRPH